MLAFPPNCGFHCNKNIRLSIHHVHPGRGSSNAQDRAVCATNNLSRAGVVDSCYPGTLVATHDNLSSPGSCPLTSMHAYQGMPHPHPQSKVSRRRLTEKVVWSPSNRNISAFIHFISRQRQQHVTLTGLHLIFPFVWSMEHQTRLGQRRKGWYFQLYSI